MTKSAGLFPVSKRNRRFTSLGPMQTHPMPPPACNVFFCLRQTSPPEKTCCASPSEWQIAIRKACAASKFMPTAQSYGTGTGNRQPPQISRALGKKQDLHPPGLFYRPYHTPFPTEMQQFFSFAAFGFPLLPLLFSATFSKMCH